MTDKAVKLIDWLWDHQLLAFWVTFYVVAVLTMFGL